MPYNLFMVDITFEYNENSEISSEVVRVETIPLAIKLLCHEFKWEGTVSASFDFLGTLKTFNCLDEVYLFEEKFNSFIDSM